MILYSVNFGNTRPMDDGQSAKLQRYIHRTVFIIKIIRSSGADFAGGFAPDLKGSSFYIWTCGMDMQHGHAAWTLWTFSKDM